MRPLPAVRKISNGETPGCRRANSARLQCPRPNPHLPHPSLPHPLTPPPRPRARDGDRWVRAATCAARAREFRRAGAPGKADAAPSAGGPARPRNPGAGWPRVEGGAAQLRGAVVLWRDGTLAHRCPRPRALRAARHRERGGSRRPAHPPCDERSASPSPRHRGAAQETATIAPTTTITSVEVNT